MAGVERRASGVLLHATSLPGPLGIGDLGDGAEAFLDWLEEAGQHVWQVLPLSATGLGDSPYNAVSAFAGDPFLISPHRLVEARWLDAEALAEVPPFPPDRLATSRLQSWKLELLRRSWRCFRQRAPSADRQELQAFVEAPDQSDWLQDWSLYAAAKGYFDGQPWSRWPAPIRRREPGALAELARQLAADIAFHRFLQFAFYRQWTGVRAAASRRDVRIFGDLPIYVALDSAEVWTHPHLFCLDEDGRPLKVAGVPPDYFSATGQRWGNPIYRWDRMAADGYAWWIDRLRANLRLFDLVRIDHFRGFAAFWEIDADAPTAVDGRWKEGPGRAFFEAVRDKLGGLPLVAEDLGFITPEVRKLRRDLALPGMRVLQFGFDSADSEHLPHNVDRDTVYYTGTHDNDTVAGWFRELSPQKRRQVLDYVGGDGAEIHWDMARAILTSTARLTILPAQDLLGLGSESRMNTPGRAGGNWLWRLRDDQLGAETAARLRRLTTLSGRRSG